MKKSDFFDFINKRGLLLVIIIALIIRLLFLISFRPWGKDQATTLTEISSDSKQYDQLARILLSDKSLEKFGTYRTPGYPVFLAVIYSISSGSIWVVLIFQIILNIISLILIYKIGLLLFSEKIGLLTAFLFALDIHQASYCAALLTDTLFVTLFIASVYYLCKGLKIYNLWWISSSSLLLGLATLVRPITFLFPLIGFVSILFICDLNLKTKLAYSLIYPLVFIAVMSPWLIRNYLVYDEAQITSISGENLLFYNVAYTELSRTGEPIEKIRNDFYARAIEKGADLSDTLSFKNSNIYKKIAKQYIKENFVLYCKKSLLGVMNIFINLDSNFLGSFFHSNSNDVDLFGSKNFLSVIKVFFQTKSIIEIVLFILIVPFSLLNYIFSLFGLLQLLKKHSRIVILFILIIIYFSIITGVVGIARYKLPIMPFLNIMCAFGLSGIISTYKRSAFEHQ